MASFAYVIAAASRSLRYCRSLVIPNAGCYCITGRCCIMRLLKTNFVFRKIFTWKCKKAWYVWGVANWKRSFLLDLNNNMLFTSSVQLSQAFNLIVKTGFRERFICEMLLLRNYAYILFLHDWEHKLLFATNRKTILFQSIL